MRLAALLLLAAALPAQASTCAAPLRAADLDTGCQPAQEAAPSVSRDEASATLRPRARPDHLAPGDAASSSISSAAEDPLLSPRATLFWDVV